LPVSESWQELSHIRKLENYLLDGKLEALFNIRKLAGALLYQRAGRLSIFISNKM
jgi:hypothetical protein